MLDGGFIEVVTVGELWSLEWLKGGYSRLIEVVKLVSAAPWAEVMQCSLPPLPPPLPHRGREHCVILAGVAAKEMRLIDVKSTIILQLFWDFVYRMLKIEVNCVSLSKTNSGVDEKMYTILFYLGGSGFMNFVLSCVCCCQLIALFWNVIAKSTWHAQGKQSVALQLKAEYPAIKTSFFVSGHMVFFLATWHKGQWWWAHGTQKLIIINVVMKTTFYWIRKKPGCICMLSLNSSIQVGYYSWLHGTGKLIKFNSYYMLHCIIL